MLAAAGILARAADPLGPLSRVGNLILDKLDTEVYTRPTTAPRGGGYPMRCARKAATVPNLRLEIGEEIEER